MLKGVPHTVLLEVLVWCVSEQFVGANLPENTAEVTGHVVLVQGPLRDCLPTTTFA